MHTSFSFDRLPHAPNMEIYSMYGVGIPTEYEDAAPANLLEGRGTQSGAHVDILENFALIEDIIRVAAGASVEDLGRHRVHSYFQRVSKY
ncbi:hypothetical protein HN51_031072 [Arachis hypogaea]